jgi:hypothetical protein
VWVHAVREGETLVAPNDAPLLVSTVSPLPLLQARIAGLVGFGAAVVVAAGLVTWLALATPPFGRTSTVGAVLGLAFFLAVQPLAPSVRDAARLPHLQYLRGSWVTAGSEGQGRSEQHLTPVE